MKIILKLAVLLVALLALFLAGGGARASVSPGPAGAGLPVVFPALEGASNTFYGQGAGSAPGADGFQLGTFIGRNAGAGNTTPGVSNTFVGHEAGKNKTSGFRQSLSG